MIRDIVCLQFESTVLRQFLMFMFTFFQSKLMNTVKIWNNVVNLILNINEIIKSIYYIKFVLKTTTLLWKKKLHGAI